MAHGHNPFDTAAADIHSPVVAARSRGSLNLQNLGRFFAELTDHAHGNLLARLHREWMALVAVDPGKGLVVNLDFQCLLGLLFGGGFGQVAQALLPFIELVLVAATEEDLAHHEI